MKVMLLGNAGAGKSSLAKQLLSEQSAVCLSLDDVAFDGSIERRPLMDSIADVQQFMERHSHWIIEGCYADILEPLVSHCETLIFLNPGVEACVRHCRARPWEPDKFATPAEQADHLENLINWVRLYETRSDEYGLARHRALFDSFAGQKIELTDPECYQSLISIW
ncbi:dihydrofolate reductase [Methylophaga lonarensis MPL]|uniref:Dihydrofolate reductase n=1 Tax=Methylophaga lonarensis MPL TaxID=1286106 RepID=M7PG28_9GAMM|nr:dihydrofolate reductase [Methylophaga lonarensis]EMR12820.1 dihydrofolate reductase [Methylophaga lonarensis MPL]